MHEDFIESTYVPCNIQMRQYFNRFSVKKNIPTAYSFEIRSETRIKLASLYAAAPMKTSMVEKLRETIFVRRLTDDVLACQRNLSHM